MNLNGSIIVILLASAVGALAADTTSQSVESSEGLGRVFMDPSERQNLDVLRRTPVVQSNGVATKAAIVDQVNNNSVAGHDKTAPAGYIAPSGGKPYQWKNGEFRQVGDDDLLEPLEADSISIVRHRVRPAARSPADTAHNDTKTEEAAEPDSDQERR